MLLMFTIYCITIGNSGTIHRLRGSYIPIPMIYLIATYKPDKILASILKNSKMENNLIKKYQIMYKK